MSYQFHSRLQGNRDQPVILFLHGFLGNCEEFSAIVPLLTDQFCCLSIDLPGHGKTQVTGAENYKMPQTARAIVDLLDGLKIFQCYLVGYSMGGRLALYLALHYPDRFPKVVLESASPGLKTEQERLIRRQHDRQLAERLVSNFTTFLEDWYEQPLFQSLKQHPSFDEIKKQRSCNNPHELAKSLRNLSTGEQPSLWSQLRSYGNPLLLLVGERDRKFVALNQEMAACCKTAQLKILSQVGHNLHLEAPQSFTMHIKEFL